MNCLGLPSIRLTIERSAWRNRGTISRACSSYQATASAKSSRAAGMNRTRGIHRARRSNSASTWSHGTAVSVSAWNVAMRRSSSASWAGDNRTSSDARLSHSSPMRSSRSRGVIRAILTVISVKISAPHQIGKRPKHQRWWNFRWAPSDAAIWSRYFREALISTPF